MSDFKFAGTVSHGTLNPAHLIAAFAPVLAELNPEYPVSDLVLDGEEQEWYLEELFDAMALVAPEGYYFGNTEGDGSDFGFWAVDE